MKHKNIFVACDTSNLGEIKKIITQTNKLKVTPKFGLQFFYSKNGRKFLENFKKDFWLDLKINDIPQTALSALDSLKDLKRCKYITVHANGGLEMLRAIKKKAKSINEDLKVLGVTILTSLNNKSLKDIGHTKSVEQLVLKQAGLIKKSGCDGIVCSAQEAKMVRKKFKKLFIVTPGIRLPGDNANDQSRVMTPNDAFKNKVSGIVIGRSLIKGNIKNNIQRLIDHLNK
ncbi:orotidine-5'-phosphate decarboxylase [Candidatus Pelagibacter sp.]|nr:orotidine-5'-phosphate decarboxylase [Candidatus Pelagibacter sp.]